MPVTVQGEVSISKEILGQDAFKRIDNGTEQMNIDGRPSGTTTVVWNGTGGSDTGGDWSTSGEGSEQAAADAGSGTNGWDSGTVGANTETVFDSGSLIDVGGIYSSLRFMLQPKAYPKNANLQLQWKNNVGTVIGNTLNVEDYVVNMDLDVWQQVEVPIADFSFTGSVQRLVVVYKVGTQRHYLDDIELQASGGAGPYYFEVAPGSADVEYKLSMLVLMISETEIGWDHDTFANIAALTNGLLLRQRRKSTGEVLWKFNSKDNVDLFGRYHPQESFTFSNGRLLLGFMVKPGSASVTITNDDVLEYIVRDDLSSIDSIRAFAHYGVKEVSSG